MRTAIGVTLFVLIAFEISAARPTLRDSRFGSAQTAGQATQERSTTNGVYTDAQQKRGEPYYVRECSTCHGETLKGGEGTPPLTGPEFLDRWKGLTLGDLFENIRTTMPPPPDRPGKLTPQETVDVIAYMLKANNFPATADAQLPTDVAQLKQIVITPVPSR